LFAADLATIDLPLVAAFANRKLMNGLLGLTLEERYKLAAELF